MSDSAIAAGAVCVPNISAAGRARRRRFAIATWSLGAMAVVVAAVLHASPWVWTLAALPIAAGVASWLQVTRGTCVGHAVAGTIEHDDFSTTPAPRDQNDASRRVANGILRDAALAGALAAAALYATALGVG